MSEGIPDLAAPVLMKFSTKEIAKFLSAKEAYERCFADKNSLLVANKKVTGRSIRSSLDPAILETICEFDVDGVNSDEVSDYVLRELLEHRAGRIMKKEDAALSTIF
jgi:hypothetical protein